LGFLVIVNILNYIDFKNLKDSYSVGHTDAPTAKLKVTYDNGRTKYIEDYGMRGNYGLIATYDMFRDLRFNQKWAKAEEVKKK
jgi:hypothetical protein